MLRLSISRATRPTPISTDISAPAISITARPRSLMIFMSCPAVSWPSSSDAPNSITEKPMIVKSTRSRAPSLKTCHATS